MTATMREPTGHAAHEDQLRDSSAAVRLSFTWMGIRRTLTSHQRAVAADSFGAEGDFLSAGKKLLDTKHPKFKALTAIRGEAVSMWKSISLPWPEPGIRLIHREQIEHFVNRATSIASRLDEAVVDLDGHYDELRHAARDRLGSLFNASDYPASLEGAFSMSWDFPSVDPPGYLRQVNPELYEQECGRVRSRFAEAIRLAEEAFTAELSELLSHLCERLNGDRDGKPKVFRDTAVSNLTEFFNRFRSLNVGSNAELDRLVEQTQSVLRGVRPNSLRQSDGLRQHITTQLSGVQSVLDGMMVDRPRRNIMRSRPPQTSEPEA
jgi:hypothetical protein